MSPQESPRHRFGGAWTEEKLKVLRDYLAAYRQALKNQNFELHYIDAFAGTGERTVQRGEVAELFELPELEAVAKGSATIALEIEPPFDSYVFIEKQKSKSSALEALRGKFPSRNITILNEEANAAIQRVCRKTNWKGQRAVLFLDPYGMQVKWETLVAVAKTKAIDVWTLYPTGMGMNRLLTKSGEIRAEWQQTLDRFLGTTEWRNEFYRVTESTDLFGETVVDRKKVASTEKFEEFFVRRLTTIFAGVLPKGVPLINSRGQVMYLLCFACANPAAVALALRLARAVVKKTTKA